MFFYRSIAWYWVKWWIRSRFPQVPYVSTTALANWLNQDSTEKPLLLDARKPEEYATSHLYQAHLAPVPLETLQNWQVGKTTPIVVYCSVGYRSAVLVKQLQDLSYEHVYNLEGSIFAWANEGHPVYQGKQRVQQVHPYNSIWGRLLKPELR